jgi:hypothetical protein
MTDADRRIGTWSALAIVAIGVLYVATGVLGLLVRADRTDNFGLVDPALAILEVLILLSVPPMIALMSAVHSCAAPDRKTYSRAAFGFMVLLGGTTAGVHFVGLTVVRRISLESVPGLTQVLSFHWPAAAMALDLLAWDLFLGCSMLLAAPVFDRGGPRRTWVRRGMLTSGALCLIGTLGPATGNLSLQTIAIVGYAFVFPLVCLALALYFQRPD